MAPPIVLMKLGGSLITDKTKPGVARRTALTRLCGEIAAWRTAHARARLIVGHGSGSFGHPAAADAGLKNGADVRRRLGEVGRTQQRAADLHRLVMAALMAAGARPFSLAPSSFLAAADGRIDKAFLEPLFAALHAGFLPVVYGDVVADRTRGAIVVSTEDVLLRVAAEAARRAHRVTRAVWLGETKGVTGAEGRTIPRLTVGTALRAARQARGAAGIDVTGGMALRLRTAAALARAHVPSVIVDGRRHGIVAASIGGRARGTLVTAS